MKHVFSDSGLRNLEAFCFSECLFAFDYDGTLAKIVQTPSQALMSKTTEKLLRELSRISDVAIISGRSIRDIKRLLKIKPRRLIGNHGLEGLQKSHFSSDVAFKACQKWKKILAKAMEKEVGISIENKRFSLAIHYRMSRQKKEAKARILASIKTLDPQPRLIMGKYVANLVPAGAPHKGFALIELMNELKLSCAIYVGDDDTDEDVFALPESHILTIRVGKKINSRARFFLKQQTEINRLIKHMQKLRTGICET